MTTTSESLSPQTGLKVECALDEGAYEKGIKITDAEMEALDIRGDTFHPECNYYTVHPRPKKCSSCFCGSP
jgi:hypothetical protein